MFGWFQSDGLPENGNIFLFAYILSRNHRVLRDVLSAAWNRFYVRRSPDKNIQKYLPYFLPEASAGRYLRRLAGRQHRLIH